jgi:hypothetical protein
MRKKKKTRFRRSHRVRRKLLGENLIRKSKPQRKRVRKKN